MAVAYRSDTGTLTAGTVTGPVGIAFVSTQPSKGDLIVGGGGLDEVSGNLWNPRVTDDVNAGRDYQIDVVQGTNGEVSNIVRACAFIASLVNRGKGFAHTVYFDTQQRSGSQFNACGAIAFSNPDPRPLDVVASASTTNVNQASQDTGTTAVTARADSVAVIAMAVNNNADIVSLSATGYTVPVAATNGTSTAIGGLAYKILTSKATQAATWTYGATSGAATDDHAACIAVYKGVDPSATPTYGVSRPWLARLTTERGIVSSAMRDIRSWW